MTENIVFKDWSLGMESTEYEDNLNLIISESIKAVASTAITYYVNLVTPSNHGNPEKYLSPILQERFRNRIKIKFIDQCGCGGYVLRVTKVN